MTNGTQSTTAQVTNPIVGVLQVLVPSALAFAVGKGWISQSDVGGLTTALVTLGATVWSGFTTGVL